MLLIQVVIKCVKALNIELGTLMVIYKCLIFFPFSPLVILSFIRNKYDVVPVLKMLGIVLPGSLVDHAGEGSEHPRDPAREDRCSERPEDLTLAAARSPGWDWGEWSGEGVSAVL